MSASVTASTIANAPKSVVWAVLADFENIADYTSTVKTSVSTSDEPTGLGAGRACDLAPLGSIKEEIIEYVPEEKMVIAAFDAKGIPIKGSTSSFELEAIDDQTAKLTFSAIVEAKGGLFSGLVSKRLESRLPKGTQRLLDDLAASAEAKESELAT